MKSLLVVVPLILALNAETVLSDSRRGSVKRKYIQLEAGTFNIANLKRLAYAELRHTAADTFAQIVFYGDAGGPPLPKPSHIDYNHWRELYYDQMRVPTEIAEMISIRHHAVLRIHGADGRVSRIIIAGADPLKIETGGSQIELLYFAFTSNSPYIAQRVDVYARMSAPLSSEAGLKLLKMLDAVFGDLEVSVFVRSDPWFVFEPNYPFANPFVEAVGSPPEEYQHTETLRCGHWSGSASCDIK